MVSQRLPRTKVVEHGGAIDGMRAEVAMIPEEKLGLVILTNLHGTILASALMYKIFDIYLNAPQRDWSADMLKVRSDLEEQAKAAEKKAEVGTRQGHVAVAGVGEVCRNVSKRHVW